MQIQNAKTSQSFFFSLMEKHKHEATPAETRPFASPDLFLLWLWFFCLGLNSYFSICSINTSSPDEIWWK